MLLLLLVHGFNLMNKQGWIQDFPWGGAEPLGGANLQHGHFLAKMYAKMKELDRVGGHAPVVPPLDPPMVNICSCYIMRQQSKVKPLLYN